MYVCESVRVGRRPCATARVDCAMCVCLCMFACLRMQGASSVRHRCVFYTMLIECCTILVGFNMIPIDLS